jgi:hypothetical protein
VRYVNPAPIVQEGIVFILNEQASEQLKQVLIGIALALECKWKIVEDKSLGSSQIGEKAGEVAKQGEPSSRFTKVSMSA